MLLLFDSFRKSLWLVCLLTFFFAAASTPAADTGAFDLVGPRVEMKVNRNGKSLPIAAVPNLLPGDRLWIHPEFPDDQSARYLLVVAFLRGPTNPPPAEWFTKAETWTRAVREEGINVIVPKDAQQALVFLAPDTGGGFSTLRSTVTHVPGVFVRASGDLHQASLYRSRLDLYLDQVRQTSHNDPNDLHDKSLTLARTLKIKVNQDCFDRPTEQQASCLMQNSDRLVLDDGHSNQSVVATLTSGPSTDLIGAITATPMAGGGFYSAYVGAVVDVAKIMANIHNARYQYIPALALPRDEQLNLRLNNPPSFRSPKSVLVVGLPPVAPVSIPTIRPLDPNQIFCLHKSSLVLPVDSSPITFSTGMANNFVLHIEDKTGKSVDLPAAPDAVRGGFVVETSSLSKVDLAPEVVGSLRGNWGFEPFEGPSFHFRTPQSTVWTLPNADRNAVVVGREDVIHLQSACAVCVDQIDARDNEGYLARTSWKLVKPDVVEVHLPLEDRSINSLILQVKQAGLAKPDQVFLRTFTQSAHVDRFSFSAGDQEGVLLGTRLDQVNAVTMNGVRFVPAKLYRVEDQDELSLSAPASAAVASLQPEDKTVAHVDLRDGRVIDLQTTVSAPRPKLVLLSKTALSDSGPSPIRLGGANQLPLKGRLSFSFRSEFPKKFPRSEKIELATADGSAHAMLSLSDGTLTLQDSQSVLAVFDPLKSLGPSAFGELRFRAVTSDGRKSDWQPLATLVRLPDLKEVRCSANPDQPCKLVGSSLFLISSVASDAEFAHSAAVPEGFADSSLSVPRPNGTLLYLKLRDDPSVVSTAVLPVLPEE